MIGTIQNFKNTNFYEASASFLKKLNIPINEITTLPIDKNDLFDKQIKVFEDIETIYAMGMIDDEFFKNDETKLDTTIAKRYDGVLIFGVELSNEKPTRKTLADISRAFNKEYLYTPVIVIFKYANRISLSNTQRQAYKIDKEGEKAGKVTILRDISIEKPHAGHIKILEEMQINSKKSNQVDSYEKLYEYWQTVFDVSILNKSFYKELSNWYFWTLKNNNVSFPNAPKGLEENADRLRNEHNAKNVIRLLTRILFVWFMKEKGLIPNELFEEEYIKDNLLKEFEPKKADGLFKDSDRASKYYKAVLQNLFFATLNQEQKKRAFRNDKQHRNITNLMRYENYFKNSDAFVELVEKVVPFMNGGLFECLDKEHPTLKGRQGGAVIVYEDGFSDRPDNELIVPDYIFFGLEEHVDLSSEYGSKGKANKDTKIKGLINILESYKFTIAENTPIEEDVALDPELLGKVFENLLASYNPETKTTARKQTGSFYTPREIVSYMVDESLIAYLKTKLETYEDKEDLDKKLHQLLSYDEKQPFEDKESVLKIINAIDTVKILDPAVGSGAFPMGTLQKMVHLLHKLDPNNEHWQDLQLEKANRETNDVFKKINKSEIKQKVDEILEAFDESVNNPDYARKLYLIENSIFGVDIQPIAIQISKLRFFISLVVEQNVNNGKANFGIRPLPNLESKFVTANTLIGIEKAENKLFDHREIKELEKELKIVRHKIFNAKTKDTKDKYREKDKELREQISLKLIENGLGNDTAKQLASWNPYDQNASSPFFDMEWMFGIEEGFDIVIANPPYIDSESMTKTSPIERKLITKNYKTAKGNWDIFIPFIEFGLDVLKENRHLTYIIPNKILSAKYGTALRELVNENYSIYEIFDVSTNNIFEVDVYPVILSLQKRQQNDRIKITNKDDINIYTKNVKYEYENNWALYFNKNYNFYSRVCSQFKLLNENTKFNLYSSASVSEAYEVKEIIENNQDYDSKYIKLINTGTIDPYKCLWGVKAMAYIKDKYLYPIVKIDKIKSKDWTSEPKIALAGMAIRIEAFLDIEGEFLPLKSTTVITSTDNDNLKFISGILNSKLLSYIFKIANSANAMAGGYLNVNKNNIGLLPIPTLQDIAQQPFINIVDKIMEQKVNDEDTTDLETQLDAMVYKLYGLSDDEIDIVEGRV